MFKALKKNIKELLRPDLKVKLTKIPARLEKLGTHYGGWTIPVSLIGKESICYLAGAGEDISFDVALADRFGCDIYIFDPTPRAKAHFDKLIHTVHEGKTMPVSGEPGYVYKLKKEAIGRLNFRETGIWKSNEVLRFFAPKDDSHVSHSISNLQQTDHYFEAPVRRLADIMNENGHQAIDILKLDIEGAEYEVIDTILQDRLRVKILCVEFHPSQERGLEPAREAIKKLEQSNFKVIAKEDLDLTFLNTGI